MKTQKYDKSIYVRVTKDEHKKILHNAYEYKSMCDYIRKKLLDCEPPKHKFKAMCSSCVNCKYLDIIGNKCKYIEICQNAIEVHADDSERKPSKQRYIDDPEVREVLESLKGGSN